MTLKEIAMELLDKYRDSEEGLIWEYSGDIRKSTENLDNICNTYRNMIMEAAADLVSRDEGIRMGAELAAMHGSDATSQQLEKAFFDGMEEAMKKRDVRPVVHGHNVIDVPSLFQCSICGWHCDDTLPGDSEYNFCPNCGAQMENGNG